VGTGLEGRVADAFRDGPIGDGGPQLGLLAGDEVEHDVANTRVTVGLVGQEKPGRSPEQAERDMRIRDIVLDFATGEQTRLWPAVMDRPASGSVGNPPFEADAHYQAALDLWENIGRP
jgi:hypothetical protein